MAVRLHASGAAHARSLNASDAYDNKAPWLFSAEDGDKLLGSAGTEWNSFAQFHLGEDVSASEHTKARYKYPYGKDGKVYGAALRSIRSRAAAAGDTEVFDEAGRLLNQIDRRESPDPDESDDSLAARGGLRPFPRHVAARIVTEPQGYRVTAAADGTTAAMYIYGPIGMSWFGDGVTANQFRQDLAALGDVKTIDVRINSEGGDVFDAQSIYSLLVQHPANVTVHVDGLAASAASFIAMAGDVIEISQSAYMMVHNASGGGFGTADEMRKTADILDSVSATMCQLYCDRTKCSPAEMKAYLDAETWMNGTEAVANGFADKVVPNMSVAACVSNPKPYKHLPAALFPNRARAVEAIGRIEASFVRR